MALSALILFTGCQKEDPIDPPQKFKVTFDSKGGSAVSEIGVEEGKKITKPTNPTYGDYIFADWYKEAGYTTKWDFDTDLVTKDITLYAKWTIVTYETLQSLVWSAYHLRRDNYTNKSFGVMQSKLQAAAVVLSNGSSTSAQIIKTAYTELSTAINALVALPKREVAEIFVSNLMIDGVVYVDPKKYEYFYLWVYAYDASGNRATDDRVTFEYDAAKLAAWVDSDIYKDDNRLEFIVKCDLAAGQTVSVTIKSAENPAISKTVTLKVLAEGEMKAQFISAVNALPAPDKISYEHIKSVHDAENLYNNLSYEDAAVKAAYEKLRKCSEVVQDLPTRMKYFFKGNVCTVTSVDYVYDNGGSHDFIFAANGAFPAGTYGRLGEYYEWIDVGEYFWWQDRLTLKSDGTGVLESREAKDFNGTDATAWKEDAKFTYTYTGTQTAGGMFILTYERGTR